MNKFTKKLSLILTSVMLCASLAMTSVASAYSSGKRGYSFASSATASSAGKLEEVTNLKSADTSSMFSDDYLNKSSSLTGEHWVIVSLEGQSLSDRTNGDVNDYMDSFAGSVAAREIEKEQKVFLKRLAAANVPYEYKASYNTIANAVAVKIDVKNISEVKKIQGVSDVTVSEYYYAPQDIEVTNATNVWGTGIYQISDELRNQGYDGSGMVVAVLDTGLDYSHAAFQTKPEKKAGVEMLDKATVAKRIFDGDTSKGLISKNPDVTVDEVYYNSKVPFAYDYADNDPDVYPSYSHHGTHVAGIIAGTPIRDKDGNEEYIKDQDGNEILDKNGNPMTFTGVAPNAQLAIFKVFTDNEEEDGLGGAETVNILCALEDCVKLKVNVINMSLGSSAGFSTADNEFMQTVYDNVRKAGISLMVAASNDYSSAYNGVYGTNLATSPDSATVGSPSTFDAAMSVASINGQKAKYVKVTVDGEDKYLYFTEASDGNGNQKDFIKEILNNQTINVKTDSDGNRYADLQYVVVPGFGQSVDYANTDVHGKVAVVRRGGDVTFEEKVRVAKQKGAVACIIYNNVSGAIRMSLGNLYEPVPTCSITMDAANTFVPTSNNSITARTGTLRISEGQKAGPFMSDFSSWGPTPDLKLKPEISAHGGEITSSVPNGWAELSGTSMATPNLAGVMSLMLEYVKKNSDFFGADNTQRYSDFVTQANRLLMSTATIAYDEYNSPYSPRKQGSGLADMNKATKTQAYIYVKNSDKTKIEVGDDPKKTGEYKLTFNVRNFGSTDRTYEFDTLTMTETLASDKISVAERAYMLDGQCDFTFTLNSKNNGSSLSGKTLTLKAGDDVNVTVTVKLKDSAKKYIDDSFANGMYVEGFVKLIDKTDGKQVDLNVPWLGFYGDWYAAAMFDISDYELSEKLQDDSIPDDRKPKAQMYATTPLGSYYGSKYIIPLGAYLYTQKDDQKKIYPSTEKAAISIYDTTNRHTVYKLYAIYAGLLRGAKRMNMTITDAVTGEVVYSREITNVRKSYTGGSSSARGSFIEVEWSPIAQAISNNKQYKFHVEGVLDDISEDRKYNPSAYSYNKSFDFTFYVDTEAPEITDYKLRFESYKDDADKTRYKVYLDINVFDNRYAQSVALCYADYNEMALKLFDSNLTPVYSESNSTTAVTLDVTDYYEAVKNKTITDRDLYLQVDDYALNTRVYRINDFCSFADAVNYPDEVNITSGTEASGDEEYSREITIGVNEAQQLATSVAPADKSSMGLYWKSYDEGIVKVRDGEIFGVSAGDAIVKVFAGKDEYANAYDGILVHVVEGSAANPSVTRMSFGLIPDKSGALVNPTNVTVDVHQNTRIEMKTLVEPWYYDGEVEVKWSTSSASIATVSSRGIVTTHKEGTVNVYADLYINGKKTIYSASTTLNVGAEFIVQNGYLREYHGAGGKVVIPKSLNVYYIYEEAFKDNDNIEELEISSPCTEIQQSAFEHMTALKRVILPHTVNFIYKYAFRNCPKLETIDMHSMSVAFGMNSFENCVSLKNINNVTLLNGLKKEDVEIMNLTEGVDFSRSAAKLTTMGNYAFKGCTSLQSIDITELRVAGHNVFEGCRGLTTVTLSKFTDLGDDMFFKCTSLTKLIYTDLTADDIGSISYDTKVSPFGNCNITEVVFGDGLLNLANGAWYNSDATVLYKVKQDAVALTVPATVTEIAANAFAGNTKLRSVTFTAGENGEYALKKIGNYAFSGCSSLTSVTLPASVNELGTGVFSWCSALTSADLSGVAIKELPAMTFAYAGVDVVTDELGNASEKAVLTNVKLNAATRSLGARSFFASGLATVDLSATGVISIGDGAFANCEYLQEVTLGDITAMGNDVFSGIAVTNPVLRKVVFGSGSTVLGAGTFRGQSNLDTLVLSDAQKAVEEIGAYTFAGCVKLANLPFTNVVNVGEGAFAGCAQLRSFDFSSTEYVGAYAFSGCSLIANPALETVRFIGDYAFYGCDALGSVSLDNVTNIGKYAFAASGITSVSFGQKFVYESETRYDEDNKEVFIERIGIGDYAFYKSDLRIDGTLEIALGEGAGIGEGAFAAVAGIKNFAVTSDDGKYEVADGMIIKNVTNGKEVLAYAALGKSGKIVVPEKTVRVGASAFENVTAATEIEFPYELKAIGDKAFFGCGATRYVFGGISAPVLEAAYVSADQFAKTDDLYKLFDMSGNIATQKYYANFKNYAALVLYAGQGGVKGIKDLGLTAEFAENAGGFDSRLYSAYFSNKVKAAMIADDTTRECNELLKTIPTAAEINALTADDEAVWNGYKTTMQNARAKYDDVSLVQRNAFVTDWQKLIESEAAMRNKASLFGESVTRTGVSVTTRPTKTVYIVGETFDPAGMILTLLWSDGSKEEISDGFTYTNTKLTENSRTVRITYEGLSTTLNVSVVMPEIQSVTVKSEPSRLEYEIGEKFSTGGLTLKVTYVDGTTKTIYRGYTVSGDGPFETAGKHTVTVTYEGRTVAIEVNVVDPDEPDVPTPDEPVNPAKPAKKGCKGAALPLSSALLAAGAIAFCRKNKK